MLVPGKYDGAMGGGGWCPPHSFLSFVIPSNEAPTRVFFLHGLAIFFSGAMPFWLVVWLPFLAFSH